MALTASGIDWDDGNREKCCKHGVTLADIESVFAKPLAVVPDPAHSAAEERFKAIGAAESGRFVLIAFTLRERHGFRLIRPVSARYMHRKEVAHYEKEIAKAADR